MVESDWSAPAVVSAVDQDACQMQPHNSPMLDKVLALADGSIPQLASDLLSPLCAACALARVDSESNTSIRTRLITDDGMHAHTSVCVCWLRGTLLRLPQKYPTQAAVTVSSSSVNDIGGVWLQPASVAPMLAVRV